MFKPEIWSVKMPALGLASDGCCPELWTAVRALGRTGARGVALVEPGSTVSTFCHWRMCIMGGSEACEAAALRFQGKSSMP